MNEEKTHTLELSEKELAAILFLLSGPTGDRPTKYGSDAEVFFLSL